MKRQRFRLASVLRHYELQKMRAEQDLHQASRLLHEIDAEIARINAEVASLADMLMGNTLTTAGWMACGRRSEHLGRCLDNARVQRRQQAEIVAQCAEKRKRWAIAEETLLSLKRRVEAANHAEQERSAQVELQEGILRRWLSADEI